MAIFSLMVSCSKSKQGQDGLTGLKKPEMSFESSDTIVVNALVDEYVNYMANNQFENAGSMLRKIENDEIRLLNNEELKEFLMFWSNFKIYAAKCKSFVMRSGRNNDITVMVQISESGDIEQELGVTSFHLNPVYQDGQWYLTLLDLKASGVYDVYSEKEEPSNVGIVAN